jgi:hypothetical protein
MHRQPEFFQPDIMNKHIIVASPEDAIYIDTI